MKPAIPRLRLLRDEMVCSSMKSSAGRFADPGGVDDSDPSDDVGGVGKLMAMETSEHVSEFGPKVVMMGRSIVTDEPRDGDTEVKMLAFVDFSRRIDDCVKDAMLVEQVRFGGVFGGGVRSLSESDRAMLLRYRK